MRSRIPANLRANFSPRYLAQKVDGGRTRAEVCSAPALKLLCCSFGFCAEGPQCCWVPVHHDIPDSRVWYL